MRNYWKGFFHFPTCACHRYSNNFFSTAIEYVQHYFRGFVDGNFEWKFYTFIRPNQKRKLQALWQELNLCFRCSALHGKKRRARCSTGLNNVLLPTLFTLVNNIEQCCWTWIGCNNIVQYCWQLWTTWAAKHCSILFSSELHQPERFLPRNQLSYRGQLVKL
jgi:hypothetical protein